MKSIRNIDELVFGNPSLQDYLNMDVPSYLDRIMLQMYDWPPPKNSSAGTQEELRVLMQYAVRMESSENRNVFDSELVPFIQDLYIGMGHDSKYVVDTTQSVINDVLPVITKLKYHFQRPRPYQVAWYYDVKLWPSYSYFVSSPSYPSTHTTLAAVIGGVLGDKFPETHQMMMNLVKEVAESRLYMGVHFPSDNNAAMMLSERILADQQFKKKYAL